MAVQAEQSPVLTLSAKGFNISEKIALAEPTPQKSNN
jgi:hypothetical protein